jgi:hypothetical protein
MVGVRLVSTSCAVASDRAQLARVLTTAGITLVNRPGYLALSPSNNPDYESLVRRVAARSVQMSSITRVKLSQMGYAIELE